MREDQEVQHGPECAGYSNLPGPEQTPFINCLCGWQSSMDNESWEQVGEEFDGHLEEVAR